MTKRYSPLTVVALMGAFALLGNMGARLSQKEALLTKMGPPPPAAHPVDKTTVAPAKRDGEWLAAGTPADPARSVAEPADPSAQARSVAAPLLPSNASVRGRTTVGPVAPEALLKEGSVASDWGQTGPDQAAMLSNRADATKSEERRSRFSERAAAARQPALGADDAPIDKSHAKRAGTQQSRHRDAVENSGSPSRPRARRYAAREEMPAPPAPGFRLLPFLPIFLPF